MSLKAGHGSEVYFEHIRFGASVKVSAVDSATGTEVSIVGPASATQASLETLALRKLKLALERKTTG